MKRFNYERYYNALDGQSLPAQTWNNLFEKVEDDLNSLDQDIQEGGIGDGSDAFKTVTFGYTQLKASNSDSLRILEGLGIHFSDADITNNSIKINAEGKTYTAGDGVKIENDKISLRTDFLDNNLTRSYGIRMTADGKPFVYVPWTDVVGPEQTEAKYYEQAFKNTAERVAPDAPGATFPGNGWDRYVVDDPEKPYVWMCTCLCNSIGQRLESWNGPWLISGPQGIAGNDGVDIEYVYTRTQTTDRPTAPLTNSQNDDYVPQGWSDRAQGVTSLWICEWVAIRTKVNNTWSDFNGPLLWSHYGHNGTDGDGVEYIFRNNGASSTINNIYDPQNWTNDAEFQTREYIRTNSGWYDNPVQLQKGEYMLVSTRKYDGAAKRWGPYSAPRVWSYYALDGDIAQAQPFAGVIMRIVEYAEGATYYNGAQAPDGIKYKDIVGCNFNGVYSYFCLDDNHTSTNTSPVLGESPNQTVNEDAGWVLFEFVDAQFVNNLIAQSAFIQDLTAKHVVITDANNRPVAGIIGNTTLDDYNIQNANLIRFFAGPISGNDVRTAPFYVKNDGTFSFAGGSLVFDNQHGLQVAADILSLTSGVLNAGDGITTQGYITIADSSGTYFHVDDSGNAEFGNANQGDVDVLIHGDLEVTNDISARTISGPDANTAVVANSLSVGTVNQANRQLNVFGTTALHGMTSISGATSITANLSVSGSNINVTSSNGSGGTVNAETANITGALTAGTVNANNIGSYGSIFASGGFTTPESISIADSSGTYFNVDSDGNATFGNEADHVNANITVCGNVLANGVSILDGNGSSSQGVTTNVTVGNYTLTFKGGILIGVTQ